jgi:hypothetical protein
MKTVEIYDGIVNNIADFFNVYLGHPYKYVTVDETKGPLPKIGDKYNNETKKFESNKQHIILTKTQYRNLFTLNEKVLLHSDNINNSVDNYSNISDVNKKEEAKQIVRIILADFDSATEIDLNDTNVINSLNYLVSINLLSMERVNMILNNIVPE